MRQGGQIWLKSQAHKGSTFSVALPVFSLNPVIGSSLEESMTSPVLEEAAAHE